MRKSSKVRKRAMVSDVALIEGGSSSGKGLTGLPSRYNFTPPQSTRQPESPQEQLRRVHHPSTSSAPQCRDYPPPETLFQNSAGQDSNNLPSRSTTREAAPESPHRNSPTESHPSSQGNHILDESEFVLPDLEPDIERAINQLMRVPNREQFTTVLSPTPKPNEIW